MKGEKIDILSKDLKIIGTSTIEEAHAQGLAHKIAAVFIFNNKGQLLLQKRGPLMLAAGNWDHSAAGHVAQGESDLEAAYKEMREEIGIECELKFIIKYLHKKEYPVAKINHQIALFVGNHNGPFKVNKDEVSEVRFFSIHEVEDMVQRASGDIHKSGNVTIPLRESWNKYKEWKKTHE